MDAGKGAGPSLGSSTPKRIGGLNPVPGCVCPPPPRSTFWALLRAGFAAPRTFANGTRVVRGDGREVAAPSSHRGWGPGAGARGGGVKKSVLLALPPPPPQPHHFSSRSSPKDSNHCLI